MNTNEYMREYLRRRYQANPEAARAAMRAQTARAVRILGDRCVCCGTTSNLQIDHIVLRKENSRVAAWRIIRGDYEPGEFQVLCGPCNKSKGRGERCTLFHPKDTS